MGPWAHIRFHLDGGPQGWNPHGTSGSRRKTAMRSKRTPVRTQMVPSGRRPEHAARGDLRIISDGRGIYKWLVSQAPCVGHTRPIRDVRSSHIEPQDSGVISRIVVVCSRCVVFGQVRASL
jgi:hypothetical protein